MGGATVAGVAARFSQVQLWNPPQSRVKLILKRVLVTTNNAGLARAFFDTEELPGLQGRGLSYGARTRSSAGEARGATVIGTPLNPSILTRLAPGTVTDLLRTQGITLRQNVGLAVNHGTTNADLHVTFEWAERPLLPTRQ